MPLGDVDPFRGRRKEFEKIDSMRRVYKLEQDAVLDQKPFSRKLSPPKWPTRFWIKSM